MCQGVRGQQWAGGRLVLAHEEPVAAPEVREVHWAGTVGRREGDEPAEVKGGKGGFIGGKGGFIGGKGGFIHEDLFTRVYSKQKQCQRGGRSATKSHSLTTVGPVSVVKTQVCRHGPEELDERHP